MYANELVEKIMAKMEYYENEKKVYNLFSIIFSILDVICGMITLFYSAMIVTSVVASIACGAIWCGRYVQIVKIERLTKTLKLLTSASIPYITIRKSKGVYMKSIIQNIKNNPLTIIFATLGGIVMGFVSIKIVPIYLIDMPNYIYVLITVMIVLLTIIFTIVLGWDTVKPAILRTAKKNLSSNAYDKVVEFATELEHQEQEIIAQKVAEIAHQKKIECAKIKVAEYEEAKKLLDEENQRLANTVVPTESENA